MGNYKNLSVLDEKILKAKALYSKSDHLFRFWAKAEGISTKMVNANTVPKVEKVSRLVRACRSDKETIIVESLCTEHYTWVRDSKRAWLSVWG